MRKITTSLLFSIGIICTVFSQDRSRYQFTKKVIVGWQDTVVMEFIRDSSMYTHGWDTVPQAKFWRDVIKLTGDSSIINIASERKPVNRIITHSWMSQSEAEKICYKDSVCRVHGLDSATNLYITSGKGDFYEVKRSLPDINQAIRVFDKNNCDPWYAQAILLIESPGRKNSKSYVGANGPFQLMKSVAIKYGLIVNKKTDERTSLEKSALAASRLINGSCIPYVKKFLDEYSLTYNQSDLWFRLLVLHAYHAGAGNVRCVLDTINPASGGLELFTKIWQTTCRGFKNESQNYSQIALASLLNFDQLINQDGDSVFLVSGDRLLRGYKLNNETASMTYEFLSRCMVAYESDFLDGMIPFDYFMKRIAFIRAEFTQLAKIVTKYDKQIVLKNYPSSEEHLFLLANSLTRRKRYEDAIRMLKLNLDTYPESVSSYDSISKLYRLTGDTRNADFYNSKGSTRLNIGVKNTE